MDSYTIRCLLDCPNCSLLDFTLEDNFLQNRILLCASHMVGLVFGNCSLIPAVSSPAAADDPATSIFDRPDEPAPAAVEPAAPASTTPTPAALETAEESATGTFIPSCTAPAAAEVPAPAVEPAAPASTTSTPAALETAEESATGTFIPSCTAPAAAEVPAPAAAAETLAVNRKRKREECDTATKRKFKRKRRTDTKEEHDKLMAVYQTLLQKKKEGFLGISIHKKTEIKKLGYGYNAFYAYRPIVELSIADPAAYIAAVALKGNESLSSFAGYCKGLLTTMPNLKELRKSGVLLS